MFREDGLLRVIQAVVAYYLPADGLPPIAAAVAGTGAVAGALWGWLPACGAVLLIAMGVDFVVGSYAAKRRGVFTWRRAGDGLLRKAVIASTVAGMYMAGRILGAGDWPGNAFASGFSLVDAGSIVRNYRRARMELPPFVEPALVRLALLLNSDVERWLPKKEKE